MSVRTDCRYAQTHEWFHVDGNIVTMGITKFAADELTDITYVQLPKKGAKISAGASAGEIESVKATSELYSTVTGVIVETNPRLADEPGLVNTDPQGDGWMMKIECGDTSPIDKLMSAKEYEAMIAS